jgi:nucleotide-binding universal stress UspA family protein
MAFKNIIVQLDTSTASAARLDLAIRFAVKHGAHLRGLYVITHPYYASQHLSEQTGAATIAELFTGKTAEARISAEMLTIDCNVVGVGITEIFTRRAYYADLIIVGQAHAKAAGRDIPPDFPERLVLGAGRPVLIVPYVGVFRSAADRVMVAWKEGRESARTVNDAMPCLLAAHHVSLVGVSSEGGGVGQFGELTAYLAQHDVPARSELISAGNFPVGDMLLNYACEEKMDMMVMGAFTYSRRGTPDVSAVARYILRHMTVPVLMSH